MVLSGKPAIMKRAILSLSFLLLLLPHSSIAADFAIRDGDRVVFLGDSITEQRLYTTYIGLCPDEASGLEAQLPQRRLGRRHLLASAAGAP